MSWKDELIKSEKGHELLSYILPFYDNDKYIMSIFEASGIEIDRIYTYINEYYDQLFPQKATWSLFYWEQLFGLDINAGESTNERRKRLLSYLGSGQPINVKRTEALLSTGADIEVDIEENISPYTFRVLLENCTQGDYIHLVRLLNDIKPAHLSYIVTPRIQEKIKFNDNVFVNLRRYHTVREFRVGMAPMNEQNEVEL